MSGNKRASRASCPIAISTGVLSGCPTSEQGPWVCNAQVLSLEKRPNPRVEQVIVCGDSLCMARKFSLGICALVARYSPGARQSRRVRKNEKVARLQDRSSLGQSCPSRSLSSPQPARRLPRGSKPWYRYWIRLFGFDFRCYCCTSMVFDVGLFQWYNLCAEKKSVGTCWPFLVMEGLRP